MAFAKTTWADRVAPKIVASQLNRIEQGVSDAHPGAWHNVGDAGEPAFQNAWVNFDVPRIVRFYKAGGRVFLEGIAKSGVVGSTMFTLPVGWRPTVGGSALIFPVVSNNAFGVMFVDQNGNVTPIAPTTNTWVDLSSISFRCE
jgi:hypothetical protein